MGENFEATALNPEFEAMLRECLDGLIPPDVKLQEDSDLAVFSIDSLSIVRLLVAIEDVFLVRIPDEVMAFEIFTSPGSLWNVISGELLQGITDRVRLVPDQHRVFNQDMSTVVKVFGIDASILSALLDLDFPHRSSGGQPYFDELDLANTSRAPHLPSPRPRHATLA